jgi:hypothetical protein
MSKHTAISFMLASSFVYSALADDASTALLNKIVEEQAAAFTDLYPLTIVYEERMTTKKPDETEKITTHRTETICGRSMYAEIDIKKDGEPPLSEIPLTPQVVPGTSKSFVGKSVVSRTERLLSTSTQLVYWNVGSPSAHSWECVNSRPIGGTGLLESSRLRYFEQVCLSAQEYPFGNIVKDATAETDEVWNVVITETGPYTCVDFHRLGDNWKANFKLLTDKHYLVAESQLLFEDQLLYTSKVDYRTLEDGAVLPQSWAQAWYEAYMGPLDAESDADDLNPVLRERRTEVLKLKTRLNMKEEDINLSMLGMGNDVHVLHVSEGNPPERLRVVDGVLVPY